LRDRIGSHDKNKIQQLFEKKNHNIILLDENDDIEEDKTDDRHVYYSNTSTNKKSTKQILNLMSVENIFDKNDIIDPTFREELYEIKSKNKKPSNKIIKFNNSPLLNSNVKEIMLGTCSENILLNSIPVDEDIKNKKNKNKMENINNNIILLKDSIRNNNIDKNENNDKNEKKEKKEKRYSKNIEIELKEEKKIEEMSLDKQLNENWKYLSSIIPKKISIEDMEIMLYSPLPKNKTMFCKIVVKYNNKFEKLYPRYYLYINSNDKFIMCAKKFFVLSGTNYLISSIEEEFKNKSSSYLGNVNSNFFGTEFNIYDKGEKETRAQYGCIKYVTFNF
jgi:hypothetical protein